MKEVEKRNRQKRMMEELRKQGLTLKEIGKKVNLSKQRVHQILEDEYLNKTEFSLRERLLDSFKIKDILKRGFPDFLVITKDGKICLIEVKGTNDKLSSFQKKACQYLDAGGIPVFISKNGELNQDIIDFLKSDKINKNIVDIIRRFEKKDPNYNKLDKHRSNLCNRAKMVKLLAKRFKPQEVSSALNINPQTVRSIINNEIPYPSLIAQRELSKTKKVKGKNNQK